MNNNQEKEIAHNFTRQFHLWNFPDNLFILLSKETNNQFFKRMYKVFGTQQEFAKYLGILRQTINKFHKQTTKQGGKYYPVYFPLRLFKKCTEFLDEATLQTIEQNISEIRSQVGLSIYNPKLPITESVQIYKILAHMIADGSASKGKTPYYANTCKTLRDQFKMDLQIFGYMKIYERMPNTTEVVYFPKVVTDILAYIFDIQFTYPNRLPNLIFSAKDEYKKIFLQALFDDEGSISVNLTVTIHDINIMTEIQSLINFLDIKTSKIMIHKEKNKTDKIYLSIPTKEYKKFRKRINFIHPEKARKLELAIKTRERKQRTRDPDYLEQEILKILEYKSSATMDLANQLLFTISGILPHLNKLLEEGTIIKKGHKNKVIWDVA